MLHSVHKCRFARNAQCFDFQLQSAGLKLPSEELIGQQPSPCQKLDRAYMSNVCTAKAAQRQVHELIASCIKPFCMQSMLSLYPQSYLLCCIGCGGSVDTSCRSRSYHARSDTQIPCLHFVALLSIMLRWVLQQCILWLY